MEAGARAISKGSGEDDRGGRDDYRQLGERENQAHPKKIREINKNRKGFGLTIAPGITLPSQIRSQFGHVIAT
jgi:hypothetical protein